MNRTHYFDSTGDPLIDKWEDEVRRGLTPDLEEGLPPQEKEKLRKEREMTQRAKAAARELDKPDPRLASRMSPVSPRGARGARVIGQGKVDVPNDVWSDLLGHD